jgi:hypothetical protein
MRISVATFCLALLPAALAQEISTNAPTNAPTLLPNDCDNIEIGSIYFYFINSVEPDGVGFFLFDDLPGNLELLLTDNAWNGLEFQNDEGTLSVRFVLCARRNQSLYLP